MTSMLERLRANLFALWERYLRLTVRERTLLAIGGGAVVLFALCLTLFSFSSSAAAHRRRTADKRFRLQEAFVLAQSFNEAQRAQQEAERKLAGPPIQLISYIEEKSSAAGLETPTMNPKGDLPLGDGRIVETSVEITFTDVSIRKLYDFLNAVEAGGTVKVKYLRLEPRNANQTVTAWATIATYRSKT